MYNLKQKNMKSEIIEKEKEEELKFPCLMISKDTGNVYLMSSERSGTCVYSIYSSYKIADISTTLSFSILIPFEGKIILQNV